MYGIMGQKRGRKTIFAASESFPVFIVPKDGLMKTHKKFFILSASIGSGHSQAARAIAEAVRASHPSDSVKVLDFLSGDSFSLDQLIKRSYLKMLDVFPLIYNRLYSNSQNRYLGNGVQSLLSWSFRRRMKRLVSVLKPDALIFTHPFPACAANLLKKEGGISIPLLGVITDFDIHQLWVYKHLDGYCVPTEALAEKLAAHGVDRRIIHITGIPVRRSFYQEKARDLPYRQGTVLIMGGGLGLGYITDTLKRLDKVREIRDFIVVTGQNISVYEEVASIRGQLAHPVELHSYTNQVARLMGESDIIVTKPGALSCTEALTMQLPMVLVNALPGQERANAEHLERQGCAVWVNRGQLAEAVREILVDRDKRDRMASMCGSARLGSAEEIVRILYAMTEKKDR